LKEDSKEDIETTVEELDPVVDDRDTRRVRDLLFASEQKNFVGAGAQFSFAFLHRKLDRLEERLVLENNQLRDDLRGRMEELERLFKSELAGVVEALADEEHRRIQAIAKVASDLQAVTRVFEDRAEGLEERFADIDGNVLRTVKQAIQDTESRLKSLTARMEKDTRQLQEGKADTSKLAQIFADFAGRLNEPPPRR
jgi:septal ring factor EnvC (AmiA/AmiB activator)